VLQQKATSRRRTPKPDASRQITTIPNLFVGDGRVHRFDASEQERIERFFSAGAGTSALICGDTEAVLSCLPGCSFQSCITSPPYWSLRDYNLTGQIGLEDSGLRLHRAPGQGVFSSAPGIER